MWKLGTAELAIIVAIVLLIFGPSRLPALGKSLADGIKNFKRGIKGTKNEISELEKI